MGEDPVEEVDAAGEVRPAGGGQLAAQGLEAADHGAAALRQVGQRPLVADLGQHQLGRVLQDDRLVDHDREALPGGVRRGSGHAGGSLNGSTSCAHAVPGAGVAPSMR